MYEKMLTKKNTLDLSQEELAMLMQEPSVEIVEQEEIMGEPMPVGVDPMTGEPLTQ